VLVPSFEYGTARKLRMLNFARIRLKRVVSVFKSPRPKKLRSVVDTTDGGSKSRTKHKQLRNRSKGRLSWDRPLLSLRSPLGAGSGRGLKRGFRLIPATAGLASAGSHDGTFKEPHALRVYETWATNPEFWL
jgi:hypothetical protein